MMAKKELFNFNRSGFSLSAADRVSQCSFPQLLVLILLFGFFFGCNDGSYLSLDRKDKAVFKTLYSKLESETSYEKKFIIMKEILDFLNSKVSNSEFNLFVTDYIEKNPNDIFNAYYLMIVARNYSKDGAYPFAINYYERILKNYHDLNYMGNSIHFLCLRELVDIIKDDETKIVYYKDIITRFGNLINTGEAYYNLGNTYARIGEWPLAIDSYKKFLEFSDRSVSSDYFSREKILELIAYYNAEKTWTFETLDQLVDNIVDSIEDAKFRHDARPLRRNMAKVNFFAVSWEETETTIDPEFVESLAVFLSPRISVSRVLDTASNKNEAYLKTTGWSYRISTWYFYFRKINFPADSEIHGNWEWAGIYFGEKPFALSTER